jgi:hypothetical protein
MHDQQNIKFTISVLNKLPDGGTFVPKHVVVDT